MFHFGHDDKIFSFRSNREVGVNIITITGYCNLLQNREIKQRPIRKILLCIFISLYLELFSRSKCDCVSF